MKKFINSKGFTLVEMLVVLLVISVILLLAIPNITKHSKSVHTKGCEALTTMIEGQMEAFYMENNRYPSSLNELVEKEFIKSDDLACPGGEEILIENGEVKINTNE